MSTPRASSRPLLSARCPGAALGLIVALLGLASGAEARTKGGVTMPDTVEHAGKKLVLNGLGIREATVFNVHVYVAGLYLEHTSQDGGKILGSPEAKRLVMHFVRDVSREDLVEAYEDGFEKSAGEKLKPSIAAFLKLMTDVKNGEELAMTYVPERGTIVELRGKELGSIPGADFARALFAIWLGASPPNSSLKEGLLGR